MTIFEVLKNDHRKVSALFAKLEKTQDSRIEQRGRIFEQLKSELSLHSRVEEEVVYARLLDQEETHDEILESREEHALADYLLDQLDRLDKDDETWMAKMIVLKEMVEHHVEEEEKELFKLMRKCLPAQERASMAKDMLSLKRRSKMRIAA